MTEHRLKNPGGETHDEFDRDIDLRAVVYTGVGLAGVAAISFVLMWFFFEGLASYDERRDPQPSPMPEAAQPVRPTGPTLQATPERDLADLLKLEHERLEGYGLAGDGGDEVGGAYARIPIERAMAMALEDGLGTPEGEETATPEGEADETPGATSPATTTPANPEGPHGR